MKKVLVVVAMVLGWNSTAVMAQDMETVSSFEMTQEVKPEGFEEIGVAELPLAVTDAITKTYGTCVKRAYVSMTPQGVTYMLVLTSEDVEDVVLFVNEFGQVQD